MRRPVPRRVRLVWELAEGVLPDSNRRAAWHDANGLPRDMSCIPSVRVCPRGASGSPARRMHPHVAHQGMDVTLRRSPARKALSDAAGQQIRRDLIAQTSNLLSLGRI